MVIFLQILLGIFLTPNVYILLFSELLAKAFAILLFARSIFISPKSAVTFTLLVLENRIKRTFFSKLLIANIFDSLSVNLFVIVFSLFFNSEITGHVALALKFVLLPITIVGYSLGQVLLGHWSGRGIENSQVFKAELIALPRKLAILSASITICFLALYTLVPWDLLPPDWNKSPEFILFLIPYMLGAMIWNPYSITAILFARYSDLAHFSVWRFALLFFTIAICLIFALSASILLIATSAASLLIDLYYVNKWNSYFKNNI
jgi:hypothetical protein